MRARVATGIKAECEAMTKAGDREAMVAFEVQRFTREEVSEGKANGWRFHAGWFERCSGLEWAWFIREATSTSHEE